MNSRTPTLRQIPDGRWFTKWAGVKRYFGRDKFTAVERFGESLREWASWREGIDHARVTPVTERRVAELAVEFLDYKRIERNEAMYRHYFKHLRRFLAACGTQPVSSISVQNLNGIKRDMLDEGLAPRTINHDINAMKHLFGWAADNELCKPIHLRGCRKLPVGPPIDKAISISQVRSMVEHCPMPVKSWIALNYLAALRPVEVARLVYGQGQWEEPGIFRLDVGKTDNSSRQHRRLILSECALEWLDLCERRWTRADTYCNAVRRVCGAGGPGILRHSAATHLHRAGVTRADVDLCLGHMPTRVSVTYNPIHWQPLRAILGRIAPTIDGLLPLD